MTTPARRQYLHMKSQYPDAILLYQIGDFYETFDEDAHIASRELQIVLTRRSYADDEVVPLAGIPVHALENYVGKLVQRGYKVAICDQVGEVGKGIVDRAVTRILTAGTLSEPNLLPARQNNYLVAIAPSRTQTGLAAVDVSTGEFIVTWFTADELPGALEAELQRLVPSECLLLEGMRADAYQFPSKAMRATACPPYFFEYEAARTRLCRLFGVQSLDAHTQRNLDLLQGSRSGSVYGSLLSVLDRTITPMGARRLRRMITQPLLDLNQLEARLDSIEELYESPALRSRFVMCLQGIHDLERISGRIRQGSAVPNEVLGLRQYLGVVPRLRDLLRGCNTSLLTHLAEELDPCPEVIELIGRALVRAVGKDEQDDDERLIRLGFHAELDELIASIHDSKRWM